MFRSRDARLLEAIDRGLRGVGPGLSARVTDSPPIVGAALLGLDAVGGDSDAATRIRAELGAAVERLRAERRRTTTSVPADAYLEVE